jgi:hypothetical protein
MIAQVVLPLNNVKDVLGEVHEPSFGGSLYVSITMDKVRQQYNRLNRQPTQEVVLTM